MPLAILLASLIAPAHALPPLSEIATVRGYVELRGTWTDAEQTHWGTTERLRPTLELQLVESRLQLFTTVEARLDQGRYPTGEVLSLLRDPIESAVIGLSKDENDPTLEDVIETCGWDLETTRTYDQISDVASIERLYLDMTLPAVDVRLGRQGLNWGSALFFNPTDIFPQILVTEPWQERAGVDAVRTNVPIGDSTMITGVVAVLDDYTRVKGGVKGLVNVRATDLAVVASTDGTEHLAGLDLKGDLSGPVPLGWWLEGGYVARTDADTGSLDGAVKVALGADYSFNVLNRLYVAAQVYHDSSGQIPALYEWNTRQDPTLAAITPCDPPYPQLDISEPPDERRLTLGRWYALNALRLEATDNLTLTTTTVMNLADQTGLLFPQATYFVGGRVSLNAGAQYLFGSEGEFRPPDFQLERGGVDLSGLAPTITALAWARVSL